MIILPTVLASILINENHKLDNAVRRCILLNLNESQELKQLDLINK